MTRFCLTMDALDRRGTGRSNISSRSPPINARMTAFMIEPPAEPATQDSEAILSNPSSTAGIALLRRRAQSENAMPLGARTTSWSQQQQRRRTRSNYRSEMAAESYGGRDSLIADSFRPTGSDRAHSIHRFPKTLAFGRGLITGFGCGESIGSSIVKRSGSPSGDGTSTRCGRLGSGNFGPPQTR